MRIAREVGIDLERSIVSLDGVYDCRANCGFQCIAATCYDLIAARLPI
jgi:hypothetical protein